MTPPLCYSCHRHEHEDVCFGRLSSDVLATFFNETVPGNYLNIEVIYVSYHSS